ncbi:MAG: restriction endonuclease [Candidatus Aenigmatarchaeota archaeon]
MKSLEDEIQEIIAFYEKFLPEVERKALARVGGRSYGGIIRSEIGKMVEEIARRVVKIAWQQLGGNLNRLEFKTHKIKIPINKAYINRITNPDVKNYLLKNINKCYYGQKTDLHLYIDGTFAMAIECKAYTENAMMKRILVDFTLLKKAYPKLKCVLFQLESQLGGDYSSKLCNNPLGSFSTHTLLSLFDIDLSIITLLKGERKVDKPIHKPEFFKPLTKESLEGAISVMENLLKEFIQTRSFF